MQSARRRGVENLDWLSKFCTYKRISFFRSHGPRDPRLVLSYIQEMKKKNVRFLVRTANSNLDQAQFTANGIAVLDVSFEYTQVPGTIVLEAISAMLQKYISENDLVSVAIEGYDNSGFVIAYCLMELGMTRKRAVHAVESGEGEVTFMQYYYLRQKGVEMNSERRRNCTVM